MASSTFAGIGGAPSIVHATPPPPVPAYVLPVSSRSEAALPAAWAPTPHVPTAWTSGRHPPAPAPLSADALLLQTAKSNGALPPPPWTPLAVMERAQSQGPCHPGSIPSSWVGPGVGPPPPPLLHLPPVNGVARATEAEGSDDLMSTGEGPSITGMLVRMNLLYILRCNQ